MPNVKTFSTHELGRLLMAQPDMPVAYMGMTVNQMTVRQFIELDQLDGLGTFYDTAGDPEWLRIQMEAGRPKVDVLDLS